MYLPPFSSLLLFLECIRANEFSSMDWLISALLILGLEKPHKEVSTQTWDAPLPYPHKRFWGNQNIWGRFPQPAQRDWKRDHHLRTHWTNWGAFINGEGWVATYFPGFKILHNQYICIHLCMYKALLKGHKNWKHQWSLARWELKLRDKNGRDS